MSNQAAFQEACQDSNSIEELLGAYDRFVTDDADQIDCETWNITESEWFNAIEAAAAEKVRWWASDNESPELIEAISEKSNTDPNDVVIDGQGDIHDGRAWLNNEKLIELYRWHEATYGA